MMMDALLHTDFSIACCSCLDISLTLPLDYYSSYKYYVEYNIMYGWRNVVSNFVISTRDVRDVIGPTVSLLHHYPTLTKLTGGYNKCFATHVFHA